MTAQQDVVRDFRLIDSTLRDGSHAISHQYTEEQVVAVVKGLDDAGVQVIEVTHGDGLAGSSFNYGFSAVDEMKLVEAAVNATTTATNRALSPRLIRRNRRANPGSSLRKPRSSSAIALSTCSSSIAESQT